MLQLGVNVFSKYVMFKFAYVCSFIAKTNVLLHPTDIAFIITEFLDCVQCMVF
jgi:hypothetical protein